MDLVFNHSIQDLRSSSPDDQWEGGFVPCRVLGQLGGSLLNVKEVTHADVEEAFARAARDGANEPQDDLQSPAPEGRMVLRPDLAALRPEF